MTCPSSPPVTTVQPSLDTSMHRMAPVEVRTKTTTMVSYESRGVVIINLLLLIFQSNFNPFTPRQHHGKIILQSGQVTRTTQDCTNEFIIRRLNPIIVVDFSFISALLHT